MSKKFERLVRKLDRYERGDLATTNNPCHDCIRCGWGMLDWIDCAIEELEGTYEH